ncbi:baseplate J/gp47 family protein [Nocardioides sp.]|uniref:baseplate J/gp47 family protein n=1 Tax=Nocardioides sp. TaxID=35761 RepID=UPI0035B1A6CD
MTSCGCSASHDPGQLLRHGTDQEDRALSAPDPGSAPVDDRGSEHAIVFAAAYSRYLRYVGMDDNVDPADPDWHQFFGSDISSLLAVVAVDDVDAYRTALQGWLRRLEDPPLAVSEADMQEALGAIFDAVGSLARGIDAVTVALPPADPLRATIVDLVRAQLSPMLRRLIGYHVAGQTLGVVDADTPPPGDVRILGRQVEPFQRLLVEPGDALSGEWPAGVDLPDWVAYVAVDPLPHMDAYGQGGTVADRANHLATHHLFRAICETFLGAYARIVDGARTALHASFDSNGHQPHYALFLAFVRLLEHTRTQANQLTARHLDHYYRDVLRLRDQPSESGHAHVLVELAKHVASHRLPAGTLLRAGKDDVGEDAHFAVDADVVVNRASVERLASVYRHRDTPGEQLPLDDGRLFASPVAASGDGVGGAPDAVDGSWHPFANKTHEHGTLTGIRMPPAELGFAVASHHLWLAEGRRTIAVRLQTSTAIADQTTAAVDLRCRLTTADGWLERSVDILSLDPEGGELQIELDGNDPAVTPYDAATHGYDLDTRLPVLLITLRHRPTTPWTTYTLLEKVELTGVTLGVRVEGLRSLALANDQGPIDPSKPFLAFGAVPRDNSALVIGSAEAFQKSPVEVTLHTTWLTPPTAYGGTGTPRVTAQVLDAGIWGPLSMPSTDVTAQALQIGAVPTTPDADPVLEQGVAFDTRSRSGFIRLRLDAGFGTEAYPLALAKWIAAGAGDGEPSPVPVLPMLESLTLDYTATQELSLANPTEAAGRFFHMMPFGHLAPSPAQATGALPLLGPFRATGATDAEAALYIGVRDLAPPQDLKLLFEVVDGSANPLVAKPDDHLHWSYLSGGSWEPFPANTVSDSTDGLLSSGIITLSVPSDASTEHTELPTGLHWIRVAVAEAPDAVCRMLTVAAQGLRATYVDRRNGSISHTRQLPAGTITKLDPPEAAVKRVTQPFSSFGGRPLESDEAFRSRVSERLRHKDRAITLWDHEHLVLAAFPEIYQARCLNHTRYEPNASGTGIYRELAPGHVTVVTIPDLAVAERRDPLRPTTSLRLLGEVERFLASRMSCFATLHVRNPRFEEVRAGLNVRFRPGVDETFHVQELQREITRFLSPWAFRDDARPSFNGRIAKSVLVNYVEERPYVEYVTDVRLTHIDPDQGESGDLDQVVGARAISILVSVPAETHVVKVIRPDRTASGERCGCDPEAPR